MDKIELLKAIRTWYSEKGYDSSLKEASRIVRLLEDLKIPAFSQTEKQVVSGNHRPVCKKCHCEMRPETNGVGVLDMADWGPYKLFDADLWKCPKCGIEVVGGFGNGPISAHYIPNFQAMIKKYEDEGLLIKNTG